MDANRFPARRLLPALALFVLAAVLLAAAVSPARAGETPPNPEGRTLREGCERERHGGAQAAYKTIPTNSALAQDPGGDETPTAVSHISLTATHFSGHIPRAGFLVALALVLQAAVLGAGRLRRNE